MSESRDMDEPVTRRELYEALEIWAGAIIERVEAVIERKLDEKLDEKLEEKLEAKLARYATKDDLAAMEQRLTMELRQHTKASESELAGRLVAVDQQYKDLPARVTRLEAKVFAPRKRSVATARRRKRS